MDARPEGLGPARSGAPRTRRIAALVAVALLGACLRDVYRIGPIGPPPPARKAEVRVLLFGDFGLRTIPQWLVARAMRRADAAHPFDLALQLGDDVYPCGPDPTRPAAAACRFDGDGASVAPGGAPQDDPAFRVNEAPLEGLRARDGSPLPVFLALGNHDLGWGGARCSRPGLSPDEAARRRACASVAHRSPTWIMPARHYVIDRGPVRIVVVDTDVVVADYAGFTLEGEIAFVREATSACGAGRFCFLAGHHPPAALHDYGRPGRAAPYRDRMARLLAATGGRVRAFLAGHVHTLEHLSLGDLDVFISGSTAMGAFGGFTVRSPATARPHFASSAWGYAVLEADARGWWVRFVDFTGEPLHCCEADASGPCFPVECRG